MTISSTTRRAGPFSGNGVATAFPFAFRVYAKTDIALTMTDANGTSYSLVLDSDYSVTLNSNQQTSPGGTITYPIVGSPLSLGATLVGIGSLAYTQPTDITNQGGFYPEIIEDMSDRSTIQIQQLAELGTRTLHFPVAEDSVSGEFPVAGTRAGTVLAFDSNGAPTYLPIPASVGAGDLRFDIFIADTLPNPTGFPTFTAGVTTALTLSRSPLSKANCWIYWDATEQLDFTVSGPSLGFPTPPPVGVSYIYARTGSTLSLNTPAQSSVTDSSLSPGTALFGAVFDTVSVEDPRFGASPYLADNWAPIQAAVTYALANGKAVVFPRKYNLSRQITGTGSLVIYGYGMDLSGVNWPAGSISYGFATTLALSPSSLSTIGSVENMSFSTGSAALGTAVQFTGAASTSADRITPRVNVNRVLVRGASNPVTDGFQKGLVFDNCTGVVVEQYNFWGKVGAGGQPHYDSVSAIDYNNTSGGSPHPTELAVSHSIINICQTGINTSDYEGALIHDCQIVGVNAGVRLQTPGPGYPHANIHDCHINADAVCVAVQGMYEIFIHDNLLYNQLSLTPGTAVSVSNGSQFVNVHDNMFENYNQSIAMTAIAFDNCQWSIAQGNIFRRCDSIDGTGHGLGVWMTPNSANCKAIAHDQMFVETTTAFLNQGTNNALIT